MGELQSGRLVTDGSGKLFIQPTDKNGEAALNLHDDDGNLLDGLVEVAWDASAGGYVKVAKGEKSHNQRHEKNLLEPMSATSGPLYDENGKLVYEGDPHHENPLPDDPHIGGSLSSNPDEIAPVATSHTEAYSK